MKRFVEIAVNVPRVSGVFHYHYTESFDGKLAPGQMVLVPFGKQVVQGIVIRALKQADVPETRPLHSIIDEQPALTAQQIKLAKQISADTLAPLAACLALMLPPGIAQIADTRYSMAPDESPTSKNISSAQSRLLNLLKERGPLRGRQLDRALPKSNWRSSAIALGKKGMLTSEPVLPLPRVRPKTIRTAEIEQGIKAEDILDDTLGRTSETQTRRRIILEVLLRENSAVDASWLYAESKGKRSDLYYLADKQLIRLSSRVFVRDPLSTLAYDPSIPPKLTPDQASVWQSVEQDLRTSSNGEKAKAILLHGVTGSGKTEIYLRAVSRTLEMGRTAIVLVPEIALTPQTIRRFMERFPGRVGLAHSELSVGERFDTWRSARDGKLDVIVGPRSALFTPLKNIGLIILDESHDDSYYEAGKVPHYHARRSAIRYAEILGALCILGSATPDVTSSYQSERGHWKLLKLPSRILAHRETIKAHEKSIKRKSRFVPLGDQVNSSDLPPVSIVDMRAELKAGNRSIFSRALVTELTEVLDRGEQAILFLNRRGKTTYVFCRNCGHTMNCPNCEHSLTHHGAGVFQEPELSDESLMCHHCGHNEKLPELCPNCGDRKIRQFGTGTQTVVSQLQEVFPGVKTLRWDRESTRKKGAHRLILESFAQKKADVLVGTQMLAKGLDLPLITFVGVVLADVGLHLPDYRAPERVFQVLTQVAGRAGRSPLGGRVILQTFHPQHYILQAASQHDYAEFYKRELQERKRLRYPPFSNLVRLLFKHENERKCQEIAESMGAALVKRVEKEDRRNTEIIGPVPSYYSRINKQYRWQIIMRGPNPQSLLQGVKLLSWQIEVNPTSLL